MSVKEQLKDKATDLAIGAGGAIAARGFRAWMDRYARQPITKWQLVRRFRRWAGIEKPEQTMPEKARVWVDELYPHPADKTPAQRPSAKKRGGT